VPASLLCPDCGHENPANLKFCDRCGASLSIVPEDELDSYPTPVEPGTVIESRYHILTEIERGGMGVVYRAHDITLDRKVAIKVLPEHFNQNPDVVARFKREARAMASLDHANIVQIHAIGVHERCHFFVMKYLEGRTVADELKVMRDRGGPFFDASTVVHVLAEVARGLVHAHHRGLVHRDIKPSNIMLAPDGHVTIMDFGIVKAQAGGAPLTRAGIVFGTPEYMAPEQAQGTANPDPTTDLYALGIVAYEMLVGEPPFHGPTPLEVVLKHIQEEPVPITRRRPEVDLDLQSIIFRMIAKAPQARFQTGQELLAALSSVHLAPAPPTSRRRADAEPTFEVITGNFTAADRARVAASGLPAPGRPRGADSNPGQLPGSAVLDFDRSGESSGQRPGRYDRLITRTDAEARSPAEVRPESRPDPRVEPTRSPSPWPYVLVAACVLAAAAVIVALLLRPARPPVLEADAAVELDMAPPSAAPRTAAPATLAAMAVQLHIKSTPHEALVFAPDHAEPLGTTPFLMVQPSNMMTRDLVLKKPGFEDLRVTVSFMRNREYVFELVPRK
jgi:serine/threonine protein kinase